MYRLFLPLFCMIVACIGGFCTMDQLDTFDRAILAIMQKDASSSYADIGSRVNLSASATLRRVQRMKEQGIISAIRAIVDPDQVGHPLTIIIEISLHSENVEAAAKTKMILIEDVHVQQCYYVTGEADIVVIAVVPNMATYMAFTETHFTGNSNIQRFKTTVVMERLKTSNFVPV